MTTRPINPHAQTGTPPASWLKNPGFSSCELNLPSIAALSLGEVEGGAEDKELEGWAEAEGVWEAEGLAQARGPLTT